jgi:hypothetical protein
MLKYFTLNFFSLALGLLMGYYGLLWVIMGYYGLLWVIMGYYGLLNFYYYIIVHNVMLRATVLYPPFTPRRGYKSGGIKGGIKPAHN